MIRPRFARPEAIAAAASGAAVVLALLFGVVVLLTGPAGAGGGDSARARGAPAGLGRGRDAAPGTATEPAAAAAAAAVTRFAGAYINWTSRDVSRRLAALAAASVGQARSEMSLAAADSGTDTTIARAGIGNRGTVEAVAARTGHPRQFLVVTREATTASASTAYQGLAPAWHLTVATVARRAGGWVVSGWQPES